MIKFANPLADEETSKAILEATIALKDNKSLISGIKASQKYITTSPNDAVLVLSAATSPGDLIIHLPILCEKHHVSYIFVKDSSYLHGFTCVVLTKGSNASNFDKIFESAVLK
ncbi:H/ACA ribonucleoprotein complex subunit 2 [Pancytospora epiphaga]|nr:H/ACA ribonucleoprotein complex subunit 2 [Pancytospora epiphaga]